MTDLELLVRLVHSVVAEHDECRKAEMNFRRKETWNRKLSSGTTTTPDVSS